MIFNPLFLSENNGSQIMAPKQTKMSNNKYLFSDIVKVVMSPVGESTEMAKASDGMIGNNIGLSLENTDKPVQLKLKFLSDLDNEKAKLGLAEILPIEIAQLLIKDETENSEEKAVSYISKEPLTGELQNFVNKLIGPDLIASHLNNKSGLLVSLEDSKSAVNLELVQVSGKKSVNENIVVQTLVVPEKSKLLSLMGDVQTKNGLFRIDNSQIQNLANMGQPQNVLETAGDTKPTLSVYSFNYGGDKFESLTKSIKLNNDIKPGLSVVSKLQAASGLNGGVNKVPSEKISFVQSELKANQQEIPIPKSKNMSASKLISESLKLVNNKSENVTKDFSVSKITIVKKTSDIINPEKIPANSKLFGTRLEPELKRIDFGSPNTFNSKSSTNNKDINISAKVSNQNSSILKNILPNTLEDENVKQNKLNNNAIKNENSKPVISPTNLDEIKQKGTIGVKNIIVNSNSGTVKTENTNTNTKTVLKQNTDNKIDLTKNITPQESLKDTQRSNTTQNLNNLNQHDKVGPKSILVTNAKEVDTNSKPMIKAENKINSDESTPVKPSVKTESINTNMNSKISEDISKTLENKVGIEKKSVETGSKQESSVLQKSDKENIESLKSTTEKVNSVNVKEIKTDPKIEQKTLDVSKNENLEQNKNGIKNNFNDVNEVSLKTKEMFIKEVSEKGVISEEKQVPNQNTELKNDEPVINKKISVKVKGEVKSVSEKLDTQSKSNQDGSQKENSSGSNANKESSSSNKFNMPFGNSHFNMNVSSENSFQQIMNENNVVGLNNNVQNKSSLENESNRKIIKSVEVLKEVTKFISKQEKGSLTFDIKPEQLGKMKITLDTADHVIRAKIEVDSEQARQLIERNLDKLHQELADNGIKLNSLNISLSYSRQQKEEKETMNNNNNSQTQNLGQVGETQEEEQKKTLGYNTYEYIA